MNNSRRKLWVLPILIMMLMTACSSPEDTSSSNNNVAQSPNTNAQSSNPNAAPPVAMRDSPVIPNNSNVSPPPVKGKSATVQSVPGAPTDKAPKLVAPTKTIEFGKQPQSKTLVRTFQIRNAGNAALEIENVQPG